MSMTNREKNIVGQVLAKTYRIERFLGAGTVGTVYVARHVRSGGLYAVKVLHRKLAASPDLYQRFQDEARIIATLRHPHIVPITDFDRDESGIPFFVMDLLEGESLQQRLKHKESLPIAQAMEIVQQVGSALHTAHRSGIVHRNVKPENIFLVRHDLGDRVTETAKVTDFGLARFRRMAPAGTRDAALGVSAYMAPELLQETSTAIDGRVDQWALAVIAYRMLSGKLPFEDGTPEEVARRITAEPPKPLSKLMPELPAPVVAAISRGMAKRKEDRFETMMDFVRALSVKPPEAGDAVPQARVMAPSGRIQAPASPSPSGPVPPPMPPMASGAINRPSPPATPGSANRPAPTTSTPVPVPPSSVTPSDAPTTPGGLPAVTSALNASTTTAASAATPPPMLTAPPLLFEEGSPPPPPPARGPSWGLLAGGTAIAVLAGIGVTLLWEQSHKPQIPQNPPTVAAQNPPTSPVVEPLGPGTGATGENVKPGGSPPDAQRGPAPIAPHVPVPPLRSAGPAEAEAPSVPPSASPTAPPTPPGPTGQVAPGPEPLKPSAPASPASPPTGTPPAGTQPQAVRPQPGPTGQPAQTGAAPVGTLPAKGPTAGAPATGGPTTAQPRPGPTGMPGTATGQPGGPAAQTGSPAQPSPSRPKSDDIDDLMNRASPERNQPSAPERQAPPAERTADDIMRDAQAAYVRGERQRAIELALQVAERNNGRESASAWRFIGSAACSVRAHALASRAYSSLTAPEHRQMLVDLCQRNGLMLQDGRFVPEEQH